MDIIKYMVVRVCLVMGIIGAVWLGEMEYRDHSEKPVVWYGVVTQEIQGIAWPDGSWTDCTHMNPCGLPPEYDVDSMLEDGYAPIRRCVMSIANPKPVTINGVHYDSINEAARALGMCPVTLSRWLKNGWSVHKRVGSQWKEPLFIDGVVDSSGKLVEFWCVREVAEYLHVSTYKASLLVAGQRAVNAVRKGNEK